MAEQKYGLEKFFSDVARGFSAQERDFVRKVGDFSRGAQNVGRFVTSQAPILSPTEKAAQRQMKDFAAMGGESTKQSAIAKGMADWDARGGVVEEKAAPTGGTGSGMGRNPINALFAPMFQDLKRQRQLANKRYEANKDQVTNIYGQITGARREDIAATETAFKRLVDAASTRSQAVNTGIDEAEAARLQQNQAALQGMGLEGLSTSQGDIASQTAAQAQQTNTLNSANWENMLRAMGATAGQQVQADIAGYNYAMAEDLGQLRGAREEFAQELGQQRGELKSQRAQATFEYQQAQQRAAAAAQAAQQRAAQRDASAQEKAAADALKVSGPVIRNVNEAVARGRITDPQRGANLINLVTEFMEMGEIPANETWGSGSARRAFLKAAGKDLTVGEKLVVEQIFNEIKWR